MKCSSWFQLVVDFVFCDSKVTGYFSVHYCERVCSGPCDVNCVIWWCTCWTPAYLQVWRPLCFDKPQNKSVCLCDATSEQTPVGRTNSYMCVCLCVPQSWGTLQIWVLISWATAARATEGWGKPSLIFVFWGWIMYLAVEKASRWLPNVCLQHSL